MTNDSDGRVRQNAIRALGLWGNSESVPKLIALLQHKDNGVQNEAIKALGRFKDERAAEALATRLPNFFGRGDAATGLKSMGALAEKAVIPYLEHTDGGARREACAILKVIGTSQCIPALEAAVKKDKSLGGPADEAVREIRKRGEAAK